MPEWYEDVPPELAHSDFFMLAFWNLNTTRYFAEGPIPWNRIQEYGKYFGLTEFGMLNSFIQIIQQLDGTFLDWHQAEQDRKMKK